MEFESDLAETKADLTWRAVVSIVLSGWLYRTASTGIDPSRLRLNCSAVVDLGQPGTFDSGLKHFNIIVRET